MLKIDHRVARLTVIDQQTDGDTGKLTTLVEFVEVDDEGRGIDEPKKFRIMGDVVYVDNWVVKFDDKYVETADIERSTSLVLFRRIFGEFQEPNEGFAIDEIGARPRIYSRGSMTTELERRIWNDFWNIANDRERATELGIRAAHGEAVSIKLQRGKAYRLMLRASDGLSIQPAGDAPKPPPTT